MTHPKLIEVAKAISGQDDAGWNALPRDKRERMYGGPQFYGKRDQADYIDDARIAIQSLMEPTEDMVARGEGYSDFMLDDECFDNSVEGRRGEMKMAFRVMLETILKEGEGE